MDCELQEIEQFASMSNNECLTFTNSHALDIFACYHKKVLSKNDMVQKVAEVSKVRISNINVNALVSKINRVNEKMKSKRGVSKDVFKSEEFIVPQVNEVKSTVLVSTENKESQWMIEKRELKERLSKKTILLDERRKRLKVVTEMNKSMKKKITRKEKKIEGLKEKVIQCGEMLKLKQNTSMLKSQTQNVLKITTLKDRLKIQRQRNLKLNREVSVLRKKLQAKCNDEDMLKAKMQRMETLVIENKQYKQQVKDLANSNDYMQQLLQDNSVVSLYNSESGMYSSETVHCVMDLLTSGVPGGSVGNVIQRVAGLCGHVVDRVPSRRTVDVMSQRRLAVSQKQVGHELQNAPNQTLHTDETSKFGNKFMAYVGTTDTKKHMVVGIKPIATKSADDTLSTLRATLDDIGEICEKPNLSKSLIVNFKNTMSDRASTEKLFNKILYEHRCSVLPEIIHNFEQLSQHDIEKLQSMNNFFCGLHLLVSLAECTAKSLKTYETEKCQNVVGAEGNSSTKPFIKQTESSIIRSIRTACKLFAKSTKLNNDNNCYGPFSTYLESIGKKNVLVEFLNNRFNILFYNAEALFCLTEEIKEFLEHVHGCPTTLYKAVLLDVSDEWCLSGIKALAVLSTFVTSPLWRILEDEKIQMADMGKIYSDIVKFLDKCGTDINESKRVIQGEEIPHLLSVRLNKDDLYECIVRPNTFDDTVAEIFKYLCKEWSGLLERLVSDHLPGGVFNDMTEDKKEETLSVVKHNKVVEEIFGRLDRLMRIKPNANMLSHEAAISFQKNKTSQWLWELPDLERQKVLQSSYKETTVLKKKDLALKEEILRRKLQAQNEKEENIRKAKEKVFKEKQKLTNEIVYYGLWQTQDDVAKKLESIKTKTEKVKALKIQINFRKLVLQQPVNNKELFQFSTREIGIFSVEKLANNLCALVEMSKEMSVQMPGDILVGQTVNHRFESEESMTWFKGIVVSQVPGFPEWYNIVYDMEDDTVYTFKLMDDYRNGDLTILKVLII